MIARLLALIVMMTWAGGALANCSTSGACLCTTSLTTVVFGRYNPQSPVPTDTVGTLTISCSSPDPANSTMSVAFSPGASGISAARLMRSGVHPLYYNLYTDPTRTTVWGDGTGGGESVTANFPAVSRGAVKLSIYGRIPAEQNAWVGVYHDSVTVTVSY